MPDYNRFRKDEEFLAACRKGAANSPWSRFPMCSTKRAAMIQKSPNWKKAADEIPTQDDAKRKKALNEKRKRLLAKQKRTTE